MKTILAHPGIPIPIGRCGENLARAIEFDTKDWQEIYGEGTVQLLHQRANDTTPYPCVVSVSDGIARWEVTAGDTAQEGEGRAELVYIVGEQVVKSVVWKTVVEEALGESTAAPPDAAEPWVTRVLDAAERAEKAAQGAENTLAELEAAMVEI